MSDSFQKNWLRVRQPGLFVFYTFHPMGENPETAEALILQAGNHIQAKESLNLGMYQIP
ncbi:Uncharacterized protein dnm_057400 [Desulfonema magnum]|uniref:Uncharacterized protein n=1 Tax=Desulfonema magnum TaxID=45655 RepID=A0A975GR56_9BACT|nr:Uncharacterized protein dnm_057400 [Desulfonema magnum]